MKYVVLEYDDQFSNPFDPNSVGGLIPREQGYHIFDTIEKVKGFIQMREEGRNGIYAGYRLIKYKIFELGKELEYEIKDEEIERTVTETVKKVEFNDK